MKLMTFFVRRFFLLLFMTIVLLLEIALFGEVASAKEITDYVPKKLKFWIGGGGSDRIELMPDKKVHVWTHDDPFSPLTTMAPDPDKGEYEILVVAPTQEEWKKFFKTCISLDMWDLAERSKTEQEIEYEEPTYMLKWSIEIAYPEQSLVLSGKRLDWVERSADIYGYINSDVDYFKYVISPNKAIAREYERIRALWDAMEELLHGKRKFYLFPPEAIPEKIYLEREDKNAENL